MKINHLRGAFLVAVVFFSIFWQIGTYSGGISQYEQSQFLASSSFSKIADNPVNAPYKMLELGYIQSGLEKPIAARLSSSTVAVLFVFAFYLLVKRLFGKFYAGMGIFLLIGIPLFLILARSGDGYIAVLSLLPIVLGLYILSKHHHNASHLRLVLLSLLVAILIYTPGAFWYLIPVVLVYRGYLLNVVKSISRSRLVLYTFLIVGLVIPLVLSLASDSTQLKQLLLLPESLPGIKEVLMGVVWFIPSILIMSRDTSLFIVGTAPLLDIAMVALMSLGVFALYKQGKTLITKIATAIAIGMVIFVISGQQRSLILIVAPLVVLAVSGLKFLYKEWKGVFPNNPIPRDFALLLISALCILQALYGFHVAHHVWPKTTLVKNNYMVK